MHGVTSFLLHTNARKQAPLSAFYRGVLYFNSALLSLALSQKIRELERVSKKPLNPISPGKTEVTLAR